jgi:signal peptidase II
VILTKRQIPRLLLIFSVLISTTGCDQVSKIIARSLLSNSHPKLFLGGLLEFKLVQNPGAFLSLGSTLTPLLRFLIFSAVGSLFVLAGFYYLISRKQLSNRFVFAASLALGGAVGNLIDRLIFQGLVTDFLFLSIGKVHTGVFNIADMAVLLGVALLFFESWRRPNPPLNSDPA